MFDHLILKALELRDQVPEEYHGKGVSQALKNINEIIGPQMVEAQLNPVDQSAVDDFMFKLDGTENKVRPERMGTTFNWAPGPLTLFLCAGQPLLSRRPSSQR